MKILLIGANGNMARRYAAILNYLGIEWVGVDVGDRWPRNFDRAIVATPTDTHFAICKKLAKMGKVFLCEKPVSKSPKEIEKLIAMGAKGYMVCNWALLDSFYSTPLPIGVYDIFYDFYNTGRDGTYWDCIQIIYLAKNINVQTTSPIFAAQIGCMTVWLDAIGKSYVNMLSRFVQPKIKGLWTLKDAFKATNKVLEMLNESK